MKIIDNINSKDYGRFKDIWELLTDLNISQADEVSCFSETNKCFTKDEILLYLDMETTMETTS